MSEGDRSRGVFQRPFDALASVVVPVVADAVDPDDLIDRLDVNALIDRIDLDAVLGRLDVNALIEAIDVNALIDRIDVDRVLDRVDLDRLVARLDVDAVVDSVDVNRVAARLDLDAVADRVDVERVIDRVDVNAVADRVDVERVIDRVDVNAVADQVDVQRVIDRVDVDAVADSIDIDAIVAKSTKGVSNRMVDLLRRQVVGLDELGMRAVSRVLRRDPASLPTGPPIAFADDPAVARSTTMSGRYAGPISRALALTLDLVFVSASYTVLLAGLQYLVRVLFGASLDLTSSSGVLAFIGLLCFGALYFWFSQALTGRTLFQGVVGLKVVSSDGSPLGPGAAAARTVAMPFSFALFGVGAFMVLVDRRRRALHDVVARSSVVYDWGDRPAALPAPLTRFLDNRNASVPQPTSRRPTGV